MRGAALGTLTLMPLREASVFVMPAGFAVHVTLNTLVYTAELAAWPMPCALVAAAGADA